MSQIQFYITLIFLWFSHFLVDFMIGIWPIYKTIKNLDLGIMGLIAGVSVFIGEAMQLIFGQLSDRGHTKTLIILGLLATGISAFISYTENYYALFGLFLVTCLGSSAYHPSAVSLSSSLSKKNKAILITLFSVGGALGFAFSQRIFSTFYDWSNGKTLLLVLPSILVSFCIAMNPMRKEITKNATHEKKKIGLKTAFLLFKKEHLNTLYFIQICNQIVGWGTIFLLPDILKSRGLDHWVCYGGGHLVLILGSAIMLVPSGYLADRFSYKKTIMILSFIGMLSFYTFLKLPNASNQLVLSLLFLMGASILVVNPLVVAFGNKLHPDEPGVVSGFLMGFAWCIANPIGQAGGGMLTKLFTEDAEVKALSLLGLFFIVGLGITFFLPETKLQSDTKSEPKYGT